MIKATILDSNKLSVEQMTSQANSMLRQSESQRIPKNCADQFEQTTTEPTSIQDQQVPIKRTELLSEFAKQKRKQLSPLMLALREHSSFVNDFDKADPEYQNTRSVMINYLSQAYKLYLSSDALKNSTTHLLTGKYQANAKEIRRAIKKFKQLPTKERNKIITNIFRETKLRISADTLNNQNMDLNTKGNPFQKVYKFLLLNTTEDKIKELAHTYRFAQPLELITGSEKLKGAKIDEHMSPQRMRMKAIRHLQRASKPKKYVSPSRKKRIKQNIKIAAIVCGVTGVLIAGSIGIAEAAKNHKVKQEQIELQRQALEQERIEQREALIQERIEQGLFQVNTVSHQTIVDALHFNDFANARVLEALNAVDEDRDMQVTVWDLPKILAAVDSDSQISESYEDDIKDALQLVFTQIFSPISPAVGVSHQAILDASNWNDFAKARVAEALNTVDLTGAMVVTAKDLPAIIAEINRDPRINDNYENSLEDAVQLIFTKLFSPVSPEVGVSHQTILDESDWNDFAKARVAEALNAVDSTGDMCVVSEDLPRILEVIEGDSRINERFEDSLKDSLRIIFLQLFS